MYSDNLRKQKIEHHTIAILVHDEPGVLTRISSLFMKRNFNINTLTVGHSANEGVSRMTISFLGDDRVYEQLVKQLSKLIDVIKIIGLPDKKSIIRELALVKIHTKNANEQKQVMSFCSAYRCKVISMTSKIIVVEIVGKPDKVESFIKLARTVGVKEVSRTGVTAMSRGHEEFK